MRISDWSSDVCSSDLIADVIDAVRLGERAAVPEEILILLHQAATLAEIDGFRFDLRRLVEGSAVAHAESARLQTRQHASAVRLGRLDGGLRSRHPERRHRATEIGRAHV